MDPQDLAAHLRSFWLLWLMAIFFAIVVWAYWPGRKRKMEEHGHIPLRNDFPED